MPENAKRPNKSELLMPAGSLEKLKVAILYGADAVYMGTPDMSLRTKSAFSLDDLVEGVRFAHDNGKRAYLTLNLFAHNKDITKLDDYIDTVRVVKPDGVIIADPAIFNYVKKKAPELELHVSTQANICSWLTVSFWEELGASLCVLAREVSFAELKEIREKCPDIKLEAFVHGAMCMTYSGRCMLSNYMAERGANQGNCANNCRWNYKLHLRLKDGTVKDLEITDENRELFDFFLEEECREGELLEIEENDRGSYILNSKDLCLMPKLDEYLSVGIDSLKVEGRNKSSYYVAIVARAYRHAIDSWYKDQENWSPDEFMEELLTVPNRGYTYAFHEGRLSHYSHNYEDTHTLAEWEFAGFIKSVEEDAFFVEVKNRIVAGDVLEFLSPYSMRVVSLRVYEFENTKTEEVTDIINGGQRPVIRIPFSSFDKENAEELKELFPVLTIVRKEKGMSEAEWARIELDREASQIERGEGDEETCRQQLLNLQSAIDRGFADKASKSPRRGVAGCCGRGCNGCLIFKHDPAYSEARKILSQESQGVRLSKKINKSE